jgi:CIC family chloride channel protein
LKLLNSLRHQLAQPTTTLQLGLMGVIASICSAAIIILFRLTIEKLQLLFVDKFDDFTSLDPIYRFALPLAGAAIIALMTLIFRQKHYRMGIPFVIYWVKMKNGSMPLTNAINQFIGGAVALISGFSVGREGPAVHLGASVASYIGMWFKLPYNSIRTLTGCGISAAIAASFNTPLAAVIFVMEVVFREYKIHIFIPIMLAAVVGTMVTRSVFGDHHELSFFIIEDVGSINYFYLLVCSIIISTVAYAFNASLMKIMAIFRKIRLSIRYMLAALITGSIGYFVPQALGSGMGAIQFTLADLSSLDFFSALGFITAILAAKFIATIFILGLGVPGGIIGPVLGLGVLLGTLFGLLSGYLGIDGNHIALFAVLSMAGLMAATLHSPLAALVALLELTSNPELIAPAMLVIAVSYTFSVQLFGNKSIFIQQLEYQKLPYQPSEATLALQKTGVLADIDTNYTMIDNANDEEVRHYLAATAKGTSLIIRDSYAVGCEYKMAEFANHEVDIWSVEQAQIRYWPLQGVSSQATLADAFELTQYQREGAVYVYEDNIEDIIGVIHWQHLRQLLVEKGKLT